MDVGVVVASDDALDGSVTPDAGYTVPEVLPGYGAASCASALQLLERLHSFHGYGGEMLLFRGCGACVCCSPVSVHFFISGRGTRGCEHS